MFTATLFTIARTWKQPRCPLADERIRKLWCILHSVLGWYVWQHTENLCSCPLIICGELVPGPAVDTKNLDITDAQVPSLALHILGSAPADLTNYRLCSTIEVFIKKKKLHVSRHAHFRPVLFKSQLYFYFSFLIFQVIHVTVHIFL